MTPLTGAFGSHIDQIGIVVGNLEATMEAYARTIGAKFHVFEVDQDSSFFSGSSQEYRTRFAVAEAGLFTLELIQPLAGETVHSRFLAEHGPGMHHIGIYVESREEASAALTKAGYSTIFEGEIAGLGKFTYFDAPGMHCVVEVLQLVSSFPLFLIEHATPYHAGQGTA